MKQTMKNIVESAVRDFSKTVESLTGKKYSCSAKSMYWERDKFYVQVEIEDETSDNKFVGSWGYQGLIENGVADEDKIWGLLLGSLVKDLFQKAVGDYEVSETIKREK